MLQKVGRWEMARFTDKTKGVLSQQPSSHEANLSEQWLKLVILPQPETVLFSAIAGSHSDGAKGRLSTAVP